MGVEHISPDHVTVVSLPFLTINATLFFTWIVMIVLTGGSWLITRHLSTGPTVSRWQSFLEVVVSAIRDQIQDMTPVHPWRYVPFIGTLFVFILTCNLLGALPDFVYANPMGSLSTTAALALCVFFAVPVFGIRSQGVGKYLNNYLKPTPLMLPFNIIGELSRTLALAVRLFGNVMSGTKIVGILLLIAPLIAPVLMQMLGLLTGIIQAYIFAILAMVYIASATRLENATESQSPSSAEKG